MAKPSKEELISKISARLSSNRTNTVADDATVEKTSAERDTGLYKKASETMKFMISRMKSQDQLIEKMAGEYKDVMEANSVLQQQVDVFTREKLADEIISDMIEKKLISVRDVDEQKSDLLQMTKESFEEFKNVISKIAASDVQKFGADSLQYLLTGDIIGSEQESHTMLDSFSTI